MEFTFLFPPVIFAQQTDFTPPYGIIFLVLSTAGALAWLVAAVLGFMRARAFGASTRWFAMSAACLVIFHLQLVVFALTADKFGLNFGAFSSLFIFLGALCAIVGFKRLSDPT